MPILNLEKGTYFKTFTGDIFKVSRIVHSSVYPIRAECTESVQIELGEEETFTKVGVFDITEYSPAYDIETVLSKDTHPEYYL